ncbi:MAG: class I SAM-dependent DNA methyltransferase [Fimbriimonadaceae bacterium]
MLTTSHKKLKDDIWEICNLLRGPYKRNEYRKVILPLTVLRRFDCVLAPTHDQVLKKYAEVKLKPQAVIDHELAKITGKPFYNLSKLTMTTLLDDPNQLASNLNSYINAFSPSVRKIMDKFAFDQQIQRMAEKGLLFKVVQRINTFDLSEKIEETQMGYVFEELIRIGAEQSNEEAGEHFTPREVIRLMVNLLLAPEEDLAKSHVVKTIYDPACGTGGMLSVAERHIKDHNADADPKLFGQDWNDEAWATCKSDMLIKGNEADNIVPGDTFTQDGFPETKFDYMLANPPFGVDWKQQQDFIEAERRKLGFKGRFGAGTPRVNDGALLFLQHMISKMESPAKGGSRIAIVFNGSPLFTGDAGGNESNIRKWIIEENDWLEAIVALPEQLFYNTGIATYVWILTNKKEKRRQGKVQLIDARNHWVPMEKSLGNKRRRIGDPEEGDTKQNYIGDVTRIYGDFEEAKRYVDFDANDKVKGVYGEKPPTEAADGRKRKHLIVSKTFHNEAFGYHKITVERPLRLNFQVSDERVLRIEEETAFKNLASSKKKKEADRFAEEKAGEKRQNEIRQYLAAVKKTCGDKLFKDRKEFLEALKKVDKAEGTKLKAQEIKAIVGALSERDPSAEKCLNKDGDAEPDTELRDYERVPLKEKIEDYFKREVIPHVPDAWIDHSKTKVGYEIPFNREFYVYEPPRPLEEIEEEIKSLEADILRMLKEVTS